MLLIIFRETDQKLLQHSIDEISNYNIEKQKANRKVSYVISFFRYKLLLVLSILKVRALNNKIRVLDVREQE